MKPERSYKMVIFLIILLLVAISIIYVFINNENIVEEQTPPLCGALGDVKIDEENDTVSFTIVLSEPEKVKPGDWGLKMTGPDGALVDNFSYEYIDVQKDNFLDSGDIIIIHDRSEYINGRIYIFISGYTGAVAGEII